MSSISNFPGGAPLGGGGLADVGGIGAGGPPVAAVPPRVSPAATHQALGGAGGLAGRQIAVGDGRQREAANETLQAVKSGARKFGIGVLAVLASPLAVAGLAIYGVTRGLLAIPRLVNEKILEPRSDRRFEAANATTLAALRQPLPGSAANNPAVMARVVAHAAAGGTPLSPDQLRDLVATGERLCQGLSDGAAQGAGGSPITLTLQGRQVPVESSVHTTRAIAWYMMAQAASQDETRRPGDATTDMATSGAFAMKDPGNATYRFLAAAPTAASRMSTHFAERTDHTGRHQIAGLVTSSKPAQRGIEDYRNMLPMPGGTMLFDKIAAADGSHEMFVKFESGGCPPYFKTEPEHGKGQAVARFFAAADRNLGHATSFIGSKFQGEPTTGVRQEHVFKGVLKSSVAQPFAQLVKSAIQSGAIDASAGAVARSVHKFGLPFVEAALNQIQAAATRRGDHAVLAQVAEVRTAVATARADLGMASDRHGVERRGAEVHIGLNPADHLAPVGLANVAASQQFQLDVVQPPSASERTPAAAEGVMSHVSNQFKLDANRSAPMLDGVRLPIVRDDETSMRSSVETLLAALGGDTEQLKVVSMYTNQRSLAPLVELGARGHIDMGPGQPTGVPGGGTESTVYDIRPQGDGSVHLHIAYRNEGFTQVTSMAAGSVDTDPARSNASYDFALRIGGAPGHAVTSLAPLTYRAHSEPAR